MMLYSILILLFFDHLVFYLLPHQNSEVDLLLDCRLDIILCVIFNIVVLLFVFIFHSYCIYFHIKARKEQLQNMQYKLVLFYKQTKWEKNSMRQNLMIYWQKTVRLAWEMKQNIFNPKDVVSFPWTIQSTRKYKLKNILKGL